MPTVPELCTKVAMRIFQLMAYSGSPTNSNIMTVAVTTITAVIVSLSISQY
ncbi:hypothetical protein GBAR_LOCUS25767 [Geodia barretti]|uniref:Uncharacterized protein n=1 Tax=Geodia barretti TaxID=519541 RepID=A0AA35TEL8_GEOBA|nr:hypothetical protein GBAR_LOCUS25767 [Geodia barretti]